MSASPSRKTKNPETERAEIWEGTVHGENRPGRARTEDGRSFCGGAEVRRTMREQPEKSHEQEAAWKSKEWRIYFSTAEKTSPLSIFPPSPVARSNAPAFDMSRLPSEDSPDLAKHEKNKKYQLGVVHQRQCMLRKRIWEGMLLRENAERWPGQLLLYQGKWRIPPSEKSTAKPRKWKWREERERERDANKSLWISAKAD